MEAVCNSVRLAKFSGIRKVLSRIQFLPNLQRTQLKAKRYFLFLIFFLGNMASFGYFV